MDLIKTEGKKIAGKIDASTQRRKEKKERYQDKWPEKGRPVVVWWKWEKGGSLDFDLQECLWICYDECFR